MAAHTITLQLPASLYEKLKDRARQSRRSVEAELLEAVAAVLPTASDDSEQRRWKRYLKAAESLAQIDARDWSSQDVLDEIRR
ncbi:MAG TPA: hypothetical protein VGB13_09370 [Candidatus Krumholzibacteria bacterium]